MSWNRVLPLFHNTLGRQINNVEVSYTWKGDSATSFSWGQTVLRQTIKHSMSIRIKPSKSTTKPAPFPSLIFCHVDERIEELVHYQMVRTLHVLVVKSCNQQRFGSLSLELSQNKSYMEWLSI